MDTIKNFLGPFASASGPLQDTMKLVVVGSTIETARRASSSAWNHFLGSFCLTAHFTNEDVPYDWIMHWLSNQPAWGRSREFEITTRTIGKRGMTSSTAGDLDDEDDDVDDDGELVHGRRKRTVAFMPSFDTTHTIFYKGHWLRITRGKRSTDWGQAHEIKISVVARNNSVIKQLVLEAKKLYEKDAEHRVHIYMADSYGSWRWNGARPKRPLSSIVLDPGVKQMLLDDCKDFMRSEDWYAERGIPFRRGYLLHGVPGSGKSSLAFALSGELGLDIFALSLSGKGMNDTTLVSLMAHVPSRCILLLEDLDAAFTRSTTRDDKSTGAPTVATAAQATTESDGSTLSLSGLLNAIDGISATEGRLLFATTNHIERLDPALSRPGRMDVWVNFTNATRWQAEGIFKCFFPSKPSPESVAKDEDDEDSDSTPIIPPLKPRKTDVPVLEASEIAELAKKFADNIPEDELSVASLQGYLLKNKTRPRQCVEEVGAWVIKEREEKAKLKKEKEEAEKKEKEEKEAKEKEAKAKEKDTKTEERRAKRRAARKAAEAAATLASSALPTVPLPTLPLTPPTPAQLPTPPIEAPPTGLMLTQIPPTLQPLLTPPPEPTPPAAPAAAAPAPAATDADADAEDSDSDSDESDSSEESGSDESDTAATAALVDGATSVSKADAAAAAAAAPPPPEKPKRKWVAVKRPAEAAPAAEVTTEVVAVVAAA